MEKSVSVIIPAYNEEQGIVSTIQELCDYFKNRLELEIIVVNDGSNDNTGNVLNEVKNHYPNLKVIQHRKNCGYGTAIKTGSKKAVGDYIAWYDADGQHRPEDLEKLILEITQNDYDYCIGIRDAESFVEPSRKFGKTLLRMIVNLLAKEKTEDFNSGMRVFKKEILLRYLSLLPSRFGASTVTTMLMQEVGCIGCGVPIHVRKRVGKSSVKQIRDGWRTICLIFQIVLLFRPMKIFGNIGVICTMFGCVYSMIRAIWEGQGFPVLGSIIIIFGIQVLIFGIILEQIGKVRLEILSERKS